MNFLSGNPKDAISLKKLREVLIRLEDTIIFSLIERAQYAVNDNIYKPGIYRYEGKGDFNGTKVRRYQSPDEYPFTNPLPNPIIPALEYPTILKSNNINVNSKIMKFYTENIIPELCPLGDDQNYAEAKFLDPNLQPKYIEYIKASNTEALEELLTNKQVEESLLKRLRHKALTYGQDFTESDIINLGNNQISNDDNHEIKFNADIVVELYEKWVIPLTKEVEIQYLLNRLDN
ncbi:4552_t:CDS:2 [Entrophospora sp. SA101]|nr:5047_t:CDS:2 [Entrophospora candida]CAJ0769374.1 4552_t:CDS:2 [Entrophospora sp. SA101]